jgi:NADPH:quinone reductase-like Zn-dependent oxidoreductase
MALMNAVRIHGYGGREALRYEEAPCPEPGEDEVLVRMAASSVNPFDWVARNGYVTGYYQYAFPHILGLDVSGVVEATGAKVQDVAVGQAVYGRTHPARNGAYAEYVSLPASQLAPRPQSLDAVQAAAVPNAAVAAWQALVDAAGLTARQTVLIHAAAGGVGTFAVQLAKCRGAQVIGTASDYNLDFLRSIGADEVIDYNRTRFEDAVRDVDVVVDLVGDAGDNTQQRSWQVLKPGGILLSLVQFPSPQTATEHGVRAVMVGAEVCDTQTLNEISALIDQGVLQPVISTVLPLSEIGQAHEKSESRHLRGKIVLKM